MALTPYLLEQNRELRMRQRVHQPSYEACQLKKCGVVDQYGDGSFGRYWGDKMSNFSPEETANQPIEDTPLRREDSAGTGFNVDMMKNDVSEPPIASIPKDNLIFGMKPLTLGLVAFALVGTIMFIARKGA